MRIAPAMLAIFASLFVAGFVANVQPVAAHAGPKQCTKWTSSSQPPPDIAVYRVSEGFVERVNFKQYVTRVMAREWNVSQPELRKAAAVAVKQYAWFNVLNWRGGKYKGACYDVRDTTMDQLYASQRMRKIPDRIKAAVNATWSWHLQRHGGFPMTSYRTGRNVRCAKDAGHKLFVKSSKKCALIGWDAAHILRVYYSSDVIKN